MGLPLDTELRALWEENAMLFFEECFCFLVIVEFFQGVSL